MATCGFPPGINFRRSVKDKSGGPMEIVKKGQPCSITRKRCSSLLRPDVKKQRISSAQCLNKEKRSIDQLQRDDGIKFRLSVKDKSGGQMEILKKPEPCSFKRKHCSSLLRPDVKKQRISSAQCLNKENRTIDQLQRDDDITSNINDRIHVQSVAPKQSSMKDLLKVAKEKMRKRAEATEQQQLKMRREKERKALEYMERAVKVDDYLNFRELELFVHGDGVNTITLEQLGLSLKDDDEDSDLDIEEGEIVA